MLMASHVHAGERVFRGIPVSPGVCRGKVLLLGKTRSEIPRFQISPADVGAELGRLQSAVAETRKELLEVQRRVSADMGAKDASIFEAHLMVLEDQTLLEEVARQTREKLVNVEQGLQSVVERYTAALGAVDDEYLSERAHDMQDVVARILGNLLGNPGANDLPQLKEPCIIIAHDLAPSTTALLDRKLVLGFATDVGSKTSHTAILARSMQIPAVVGLKDLSEILQHEQQILLDGYNGMVVVNPTDQTLFEYGQIVRRQVNLEDRLREIKDSPAVTLDNHRVTLSANVENPADTDAVLACGAEGVGLFRTEYLFLHRDSQPTEEEQYGAYRQIAAALKPAPVIIRTLDLGGDKFPAHLKVPQEMNPFLGWRAIRYCLQELDVFRDQLRAILRASVEGNVRIMYPMISGLDELNQANAVLEECKAELRGKDIPFNEAIEVGAMIEIPSAVMVAESLARRVKFFSLGTNDLIQYTLAVDRLNERIAHLYEPTHPAILRLIKATVDAAHKAGIWVGVCGEMAGDPALTPLLLGLGVDELSAAPVQVSQVKFLIRRLKYSETKALAEFALQCESSSEILARSAGLARHIAPSLFESERAN
jgi:phosphotransferase system enzyme I (PtsI)